jgi:hypothetical protein
MIEILSGSGDAATSGQLDIDNQGYINWFMNNNRNDKSAGNVGYSRQGKRIKASQKPGNIS